MARTTNFDMEGFGRLKKNLKKDFAGLQPVRVALLGDTPTQWLAQAIRGAGYERGLDYHSIHPIV